MSLQQQKTVGIVIFDQVDALDVGGPYEVFALTRLPEAQEYADPSPYRLLLIAEHKEPVATVGGLRLMPDYEFGECPPLDTLIVTGGLGARPGMNNEKLIGWIRKTAAQVGTLASVCTGALLLGKAGLLDGKRATTHWKALDWAQELFPRARIERQQRVVQDGNLFTSAGISAGIDLAFRVVAYQMGEGIARTAAQYMEYPYPEDNRRRIETPA